MVCSRGNWLFNDNNASVYPGAIEVCNGIDDTCNGQINEGCPATPTVSISDFGYLSSNY